MKHIALVTGASSGIGYYIARELANRGYHLALVSTDLQEIKRVCQEIEADFGVTALPLGYDLSKSDSRLKLMAEIKANKLRVEILVNNAGFGNFSPFATTDIDKELAMIQVNDSALIHLTYLCLPDMQKIGHGKILNIASTAGFLVGPLMAVYYATKAFVLSFSVALREELKDQNIVVTTLCPGPTQSQFKRHANLEGSKLMQAEHTLARAESVAQYGIDKLFEGRGVVVPGLFNKLSVLLPKIMPHFMIARITKKFQAPR